MSYQSRLQILFARYLQRNCSPQEVEELIGLLNQGDAEDILDAPMRAVWEQHKNRPGQNPVDWQQMYTSIISTKEQVIAIPKRRPWIRYAAAAVLLPLAGIGLYWFLIHDNNIASRQTVNAGNAATIKKHRSIAKQTIHLPDGSTVILNEGGRLNYPSVFTGKTRQVYLTGEGFFDIQHNPRQPFIVHTGKISVKVLGTAFNVKTMPLNQDIEVTVTRGKVQVLNENKSIGILSASQQILYTAATGTITQSTADTLAVMAWKPAEILYNDITMEEVATRLEKRFDISIAFTNPSVKNCRVSATFYEDDLPEEILAVVCAVSKSEYTITNKKIIINGKGCN